MFSLNLMSSLLLVMPVTMLRMKIWTRPVLAHM